MSTEDKKDKKLQNDRASHIVLRLITLFAILGSVVLLLAKKDTGSALAYELFVYAISISALTLTTLQSISIARQIRITRRSSGKITEAVNKLQELEAAERKLTRIVMHDETMEKVIAKALHEAKVGTNDVERAKIAKSVRRELNKQR